MLSDSQAGARSSANLYSLLMTAKANGLEPYSYLRYLFEQLPAVTDADAFDTLLPWNVERMEIIKRAL
jgi:transposase